MTGGFVSLHQHSSLCQLDHLSCVVRSLRAKLWQALMTEMSSKGPGLLRGEESFLCAWSSLFEQAVDQIAQGILVFQCGIPASSAAGGPNHSSPINDHDLRNV